MATVCDICRSEVPKGKVFTRGLPGAEGGDEVCEACFNDPQPCICCGAPCIRSNQYSPAGDVTWQEFGEQRLHNRCQTKLIAAIVADAPMFARLTRRIRAGMEPVPASA